MELRTDGELSSRIAWSVGDDGIISPLPLEYGLKAVRYRFVMRHDGRAIIQSMRSGAYWAVPINKVRKEIRDRLRIVNHG